MDEPLSTEELAEIERHVEVCATLGRAAMLMLTPQDALRLIAMARREPVVCGLCGGAGHPLVTRSGLRGYNEHTVCPRCHGSGAVWKEGA